MHKNATRYVEFRGDHPYFEDGKEYNYVQFAKGATKFNQENIQSIADDCNINIEDVKPIVKPATIKGRLYGSPFCTPEHLRPVRMCGELPSFNGGGFTKERRERIQFQPRLENKKERLSADWLRRKL